MGIPNKIKTLNLNNRTEKSLCNLNETLDRNNLFLEYPTHFNLGQPTQTTLPETGELRVLHNHFFSGKHLGMLWTIDVDDLLHKLICKEGYRATKYSILRNV